MNHTTLQLEKLTCPSCMQKIIDTVNDLAGVEQTKILFDRSKARVFYNETVISENNIINKIVQIGYDAKAVKK